MFGLWGKGMWLKEKNWCVLAKEYYYIRIYAAPASLGIMALSGWFIGMQNAKIPMIIAILINIINIGANVIFVYGK